MIVPVGSFLLYLRPRPKLRILGCSLLSGGLRTLCDCPRGPQPLLGLVGGAQRASKALRPEISFAGANTYAAVHLFIRLYFFFDEQSG